MAQAKLTPGNDIDECVLKIQCNVEEVLSLYREHLPESRQWKYHPEIKYSVDQLKSILSEEDLGTDSGAASSSVASDSDTDAGNDSKRPRLEEPMLAEPQQLDDDEPNAVIDKAILARYIQGCLKVFDHGITV